MMSILYASSYLFKRTNNVLVFICQGCKDKYIGETGGVVKKRINVYRQHIRQPQYQQ